MIGISLFDSGFWEIEAVTTAIRYRVELDTMSMSMSLSMSIVHLYSAQCVECAE